MEGVSVSLLCDVCVVALRSRSVEFTSCFVPAAQAISSSRGIKRGVGRGGAPYLRPYPNHTEHNQELLPFNRKHLHAPNTVLTAESSMCLLFIFEYLQFCLWKYAWPNILVK